jgi:membrane protease YdiL (CAAX protease family)
VKEKAEIVYVDFFDLMEVLLVLFPIFLILSILKHFDLMSDELSAFFLILISVLMVWTFHLILKSKGKGLGLWFKLSSFGPDLVWSVIIFPAIFGVYVFMSILTSYIWIETPVFSKMLLNPHPLIAVISMGLFFPVAEEVLFRGVIFGYIEKFFSSEFAIVITSIAFAIVHPADEWMKMFVFGILLNLLYYKRRTLTVSSTVHVMVNLLYISIAYLLRV